MNNQNAHPDVRGARLPGFTNDGELGFAVRTTLAGIAALFVAMWLQLDTPRWAIWTVFIVSPPVRGNVLRKTVARIVGTFIGCVVGVLAAALFPQDRVGFYVTFSLWLGVCAYWATLRRGYVSYAASLGAFTSAIVSGGVSAAPLDVWQIATDRGCATVLGILFALVASNLAATTDDIPGDLAKHICALAAELLDWAVRQLQPANAEPKDAPLTSKILSLDETCSNSLAERPALYRVRSSILGLPTALLSLQSAVLSVRDASSRGETATARTATDVLHGVADFLRSGDALDLPTVRRQSASLAAFRQTLWAQTPATKELLNALLYLFAALQALLTFKPPDATTPICPRASFVAHTQLAAINFIRVIIGMGVGFVIWNLTAWPQGPVFMVNIAIAVVIFVTLEDPILANWANVLGTTVGGLIGLALKYLLLIRFNDPLNLVLVLLPLLFVSAWIETRGKLAPFGLFLIIGMLFLIEPRNPQVYDFTHDVNTLMAMEVAYIFTTLVFITIGAPRKGVERITELLVRMRRRRWCIRSTSTREQKFCWETQMYDELQRLQAVTNDASHRQHGINLLLHGRRLSNSSS